MALGTCRGGSRCAGGVRVRGTGAHFLVAVPETRVRTDSDQTPWTEVLEHASPHRLAVFGVAVAQSRQSAGKLSRCAPRPVAGRGRARVPSPEAKTRHGAREGPIEAGCDPIASVTPKQPCPGRPRARGTRVPTDREREGPCANSKARGTRRVVPKNSVERRSSPLGTPQCSPRGRSPKEPPARLELAT